MARVISDPSEAARVAASGEPVVLVGKDASALGATVSSAADNAGRERLLAVMVGDPQDPAVKAAASEMASELFPWTGRAAPGPGLEPEPEPGLEREREPGLEPGPGPGLEPEREPGLEREAGLERDAMVPMPMPMPVPVPGLERDATDS